MKILITTDTYLPTVNGVVTSVVNLYEGLRLLGHEVKILTLSHNKSSYKKGNIFYIGSISADNIYPDVRISCSYAGNLIDELIKWQPDIIHSQSEFSTFIFAKRISKNINIPIIHTYHTLYEDYTHYLFKHETVGRFAIAKISKHILNKANCLIAPTEKTKKVLDSYNLSKKIVVIPTGIDLNYFKHKASNEKINLIKKSLGISLDKINFIFVGRIAKEKNIEFLISSMMELKKEANLIIVGDGPQLEQLKTYVNEKNLNNCVYFTGIIPQQEISTYYNLGDIFVSASTSETQGLTYIEALSSGLPLLCMDDPCLDDIIIEGKNGFKFNNKSTFIELANDLLHNKDEISKFSIFSQNYAEEKFSVGVFVKKIESLYQKYLI